MKAASPVLNGGREETCQKQRALRLPNIDVDWIIHATPINPCAEHDDDPRYHIGAVLVSGAALFPVLLSYPTQGLRDQAFEHIVALVQQAQAARDLEAEEDL